jgi:type III pantothenate kinase
MILVLDSGNSRLKWGLFGPRGWMAQGVVPNPELATLAVRDWQSLQRPSRVIGVNVAGEPARVRVEGQLARWRLPVEWLTASAEAAGVFNNYTVPAQLGADRWASLVAARRRTIASGMSASSCVVVNAGTAVTIDALDAEGVFRGGIILPGLRLMLRALSDNTAALKVAPGTFADFPASTPDAVYSGAVQAVCGAIEQMRAKLREDVDVKCFLSGGFAREIAPHLAGPVEVVDNLVLEGVLVLASGVEP